MAELMRLAEISLHRTLVLAPAATLGRTGIRWLPPSALGGASAGRTANRTASGRCGPAPAHRSRSQPMVPLGSARLPLHAPRPGGYYPSFILRCGPRAVAANGRRRYQRRFRFCSSIPRPPIRLFVPRRHLMIRFFFSQLINNCFLKNTQLTSQYCCYLL